MPKTAEPKESKAPVCQTDFSAKNGDCSATLGNVRWRVIPGIPPRSACQEVVTVKERDEALEILAAYDIARTIRGENNLAAFHEELDLAERARQWDRVEETKKKLAACSHARFLSADAEMLALEKRAAELTVPVLYRLVDHFNVQLIEYAAGREHELSSFELPLFVDSAVDGVPRRHWTLWDDRIATLLHSYREICRMAWQRFTLPHAHYSAAEIRSQFAIPTMVHLLTDEDRPGFSWL